MSDIFDNYIKLFLIIRGPATQALRASMTYYLRKSCLTFQEFIDSNQHEIYHLHTDRRCCQCTGQPFFGDKTPLQMAQMKKMFDTSSQITSKRKNNHDYRKKDMCCCYANCQICVDDVDITLLRILLNKFCNIFFWTCYLDIEHSGNFEQFLKNRRHEIFHLWQPGITCCKCNEHKNTYKRPKISEINQHEFEHLYTIDRTIKAVECTLNDTCTYSARKGISQVDIKGTKLFKTITDRFCSPQKEINSIVETRNDFSHSTDLTEEEFKKCWSTLRDNIEKIESMTESKLWTEESIDKLEQKLDLKNLLKEIKTDLGKSIWNEKHSHEILQKQIEQMKSELKNLFQRSREKNPAQSFTSLSHKNYTESSICLHPKQFKLKLLKLYKEINCETEEAEKRLKENCRHLNLTFRNETRRNGNCFFDAVSSQMRDLGLRERSAEEIRENVIDYLMENRNFQGVDGDVNIEHFINDSTFEDWARNMRTNGVFADHVVVLGMARMLETNMLIITSNPQTNPENCMTHIVGKMDYNRMPIILGHVWESHYYSLISLDATRENGRLVEFCEMQPRNHRHSPLGICTAALNKMELDTSPSNYEVTSADIYMTLKARTVTRKMKIEGKGEVFAPDDREIEIPCSSSISPMSYDNGDGDSDCDDDLFGCGKCGKHFTTYESFVTHKKENIQCTQRKRKNIKKSTDTLGISSEQKWNMTPGEPNEKRIMLKIRMQQTPGEMEPAWKHYVNQVQKTCTGNLDIDKDIIVEYIEDGSLVFWSKTNTSTVQNKAKFAEIMDRFMVNLFHKCPIDSKDETKFSFSVDVVEGAEDEDNDDEDENDVFICGRCGITFKSFSSFTNHKSNINLCCKKNRTDQQHKDDCSNSIKTQRTLDTFDESEQSIKMIKVSNIPTGSSEESIRIFFENKQNSEGGDIQDFDYDDDSHTAIFTFEEKDAIEAVMSKNLRVDGQTLNANRYVPSPPPNPVPKYDDKVFIKNISPTTTEDGLEVKSKCIPKELIFGEAESTVLVTFEQPPDIAEEIEQNIPAGSSEESIKYVSEKVRRSAVGDIEDFDYNEDNHTAIVTFEKDDWFNYKMTDFHDSHIYETVSHKKMTKKEKKNKKKQDESLIRKLRQQCDELEVQLSLKQDILEKTDKKNSKLFDENKKLKYDINILELDKDEVIARIKELGGQQNTDKKHISLNDRSELIGQKWESLYQHEWTVAYEELCSKDKEGKCHKGPERHLMEIIEWCYDKCSDLARDQTEKIQPLLSDITHHLYFQQSSNINIKDTNECVSSTFENLVRHIRRCQYDTDIVENIKQKCTDEYKLLHKEVLKTELKFVTNCCELCWLMRLFDPPLVIEYKNLEGTSFDASKFTKYNFVGNKVELIVWPALLVHEKGTYVRKGIARTYSEADDIIYDFPPKIPAALLNGKTQIFKHSDYTEVPVTDVDKIHSTKPLPTPKINDYMTMKNTEWLSSSDPFPREEASTPSWVHFNERKNPFDTHDRPNDRRPEGPQQDLFSNLSRSAEYNGSVDDHLNLRTKSPNKKHKLKPPKDGHFVSYLNTSSTL